MQQEHYITIARALIFSSNDLLAYNMIFRLSLLVAALSAMVSTTGAFGPSLGECTAGVGVIVIARKQSDLWFMSLPWLAI
jgi:hypothetical protein